MILVDWNDPISIISIAVPIIGGCVASFYYVKKIIQDREDRKTKFEEFKRKKDRFGAWYIYLHSPSKAVRKCNVTFKGQKLLLTDEDNYERTIPSGGGCNFKMPSNISDDDDSFVIVRDGGKEIEKERFSQMIKENI